jgi:hypothetical protein
MRVNGAELSIADLDSMTYTQAAFKVVFLPMTGLFVVVSDRHHRWIRSRRCVCIPSFWMFGRVPSRNDVIPLAFPTTTESSEQVSSIRVKKMTIIDNAIHAYRGMFDSRSAPSPVAKINRYELMTATGMGEGRTGRRMESWAFPGHGRRQADVD